LTDPSFGEKTPFKERRAVTFRFGTPKPVPRMLVAGFFAVPKMAEELGPERTEAAIGTGI
jgi:hypothetical protein